jgi:hypothetical protein
VECVGGGWEEGAKRIGFERRRRRIWRRRGMHRNHFSHLLVSFVTPHRATSTCAAAFWRRAQTRAGRTSTPRRAPLPWCVLGVREWGFCSFAEEKKMKPTGGWARRSVCINAAESKSRVVGVQVFFHALLTQRARACVVVVCVSVRAGHGPRRRGCVAGERRTRARLSQVKLILSPKQRAKPAASRTRTCTNAAVYIASGECPSRF